MCNPTLTPDATPGGGAVGAEVGVERESDVSEERRTNVELLYDIAQFL